MAPCVWKSAVAVGLLALTHAAFSVAQHRSYMRLTEKNDSLPIDVVLQTLLAFIATCYGIVHIAGEFKDMDASSDLENKTFDTMRNHPSFYLFNHRGRERLQQPGQQVSQVPAPEPMLSSPLQLHKQDTPYH